MAALRSYSLRVCSLVPGIQQRPRQRHGSAQLVIKGGVQIPDARGHARSVSPKRAERRQLLESRSLSLATRMSSHLSPVHTTCLTPNPTFLFLRVFAILQLVSHFFFF